MPYTYSIWDPSDPYDRSDPLHYLAPKRLRVWPGDSTTFQDYNCSKSGAHIFAMAYNLTSSIHSYEILLDHPDRMRGWLEWLNRAKDRRKTLLALLERTSFAPAHWTPSIPDPLPWPPDNISVGVTVSHQDDANRLIPGLLSLPFPKFVRIQNPTEFLDISMTTVDNRSYCPLAGEYWDDGPCWGGSKELGPKLDYIVTGDPANYSHFNTRARVCTHRFLAETSKVEVRTEEGLT